MKFKAVESDEGRLTAGKTYYGSIVLKSEPALGHTVPPRTTHQVRIVVFNDKGEWREYRPSRFKPVEE